MRLRLNMTPHAAAIACALALALPPYAHAHGDWPAQHGGMMNDGETSFELVSGPDKLRFYVSDHGEPIRTAGSHAVLTITRRGAALPSLQGTPIQDNGLAFPNVAIQAGDKLAVRVTFANGSISVGHFDLANVPAIAKQP